MCIELNGFIHWLFEGVLWHCSRYVATITSRVGSVCIHASTRAYASTRHHIIVRIFCVKSSAYTRLEYLVTRVCGLRLSLAHYVLLELKGIVVATPTSMSMLLKRNLLELLLTATKTFVRLLAVLALLKLLSNRFLVWVALHVVVQRTHCELWAIHESILMVSSNWLGARIFLLSLRLLPNGIIPACSFLLIHLSV